MADGHPPFLQGVAAALVEAGFTVAGGAATSAEALALLESVDPDVVVLDATTLGMSGDELARACARTRVVLFTGGEPGLADALEAGALAYVFKSQPLDRLVEAVDDAAAGRSWVDPAAAPAILARGAAVASLTSRERDVLALVADGHGYGEVAERLSITVSTVQQHMGSAMARLSADTRTQAVATALRLYLID